MSLVIAAISKDNDIIVCGEGRAVNPINDEVLAENTRKAFKFNDSLIVAFTGHDTKITPLRIHINLVHLDYDKWDVDSIYKEALKYELENYKNEKGNLHFLAAGYDENNNPHLYVIGASETAVGSYDYFKERTVSIGDLDCVLDFDKEKDSIEIIESKIAKTIEEIAKTDQSINDKITANPKLSLTTQYLD